MQRSQGLRVGYIRVSSLTQNTVRQLDGMDLDKVFVEKASGRDINRMELQRMLDYVREGDEIYVHSMDRLARSLSHLIEITTLLSQKGCTVFFVKEKLELGATTSPVSRLILHIMAAVSEFEVEMIRERQREGIEMARRAGKYRKKELTDDQLDMIRRANELGLSRGDLAEILGIGTTSLYKYLRELSPGYQLPSNCPQRSQKKRLRAPRSTMSDELGSADIELDDEIDIDLEEDEEETEQGTDLVGVSEDDLEKLIKKMSI